MGSVRPIRPLRKEPPALHTRAMDNLRYIREKMEGASEFTGLPGWGGVAMGITALGAAWLASHQPTRSLWLEIWIGEALLSISIAAGAVVRKVKRAAIPLLSKPGRRFAFSFSPPMFAGLLLTIALFQAGFDRLLPGAWLLLYGASVTAGGALSVKPVPIMGTLFMMLGAACFLVPVNIESIILGAGFGALHLAFGYHITRHYGG